MFGVLQDYAAKVIRRRGQFNHDRLPHIECNKVCSSVTGVGDAADEWRPSSKRTGHLLRNAEPSGPVASIVARIRFACSICSGPYNILIYDTVTYMHGETTIYLNKSSQDINCAGTNQSAENSSNRSVQCIEWQVPQ